MTTLIEIVKGDKLFDINFTLQDSFGAAVDLTGATLYLKVQKQNAAALKFTGTITVVQATAGTCKYTAQATDFDAVGDYYAEIEGNFAGGKIITWDGIVIRVKPELPR